MNTNPLHRLMNPNRIAIVGAGNNVFKMGATHALSMIKDGFKGTIYPIHPRESTVLGLTAYPSVEALPEVPDLAFIVVPSDQVLQLLANFGEKGTTSAVIVTAGFAEMSDEGRQMQERLIEVADKYGIRFLGPNCIGMVNSAISLNTTVHPYTAGIGSLGFASQSGTYVTQTFSYLERHGVRFSKAISVGNSASIDITDALEYLGEDEQTKAISLYIEAIRDIPRFIKVARKITPKKPVLAQYVGGSNAGARSSLSHTGSLAAPEHLYDGMFKQAGVIKVNGIEELYQYGNMLAVQPLIKGKRIAILTNSGGPGSAMSNTLEKGGMEVPRFSEELQEKIRPLMPSHAPCGNPVDMTFSLDLEALTSKIPRLVLASGEVDGIILHGGFRSAYLAARYSHFKDFLNNIPLDELVNQLPNVSQELVSVASEFGSPMAVSSFYGIKDDYASAYVRNNIPVFGTPEKTAGAMIILQRYREIHDRKPYQTAEASLPSSGAAKMIREALLGRQKNFDEFGSKRFLDHYGIPVTKDILVASEEETASTADMLGYPLVLKASVENILHKTGKDLISLNQKTRDDAVAAFRSIQQSAGRRVPVIMCRMVRGEREFVAGVVRTPEFGPSVMFGLGGIFTEAIEDTVFRPAPISENDAAEMLMDLRSKKLLGEFRGMPAVNTRSLALLLHRLSLIPVMHPEVSEIDINPIIIEGSEPVAVDALVLFNEMVKTIR